MDPTSFMAQFSADGGGRPGAGFKLATKPIPHRRHREALLSIADLHQRRLTHAIGEGLLLNGPSGAGKSTILHTYHAAYPRTHEAERTHIPVLFVKVPSSPTTKSLAGAILTALGKKNAHRGTAPEKTTWIYDLFARCGVEIVLLDEFQHLFYPPTLSAFRDITDWLKNFLEDTQVGLVGSGLPAAELVVDSNEQLARRFSERIRITPFSYDDADDFLEFRGILKAFAAHLPLPTETPLFEANLARRFHVGSYGLLDYVIKILEGAASVAAAAGLDSIDLTVLAAGFRNRVWRDVPERLNPFHPESLLRPLDRVGEVFHLHTRQDPVGSPFARRLRMDIAKGGH